MLRAISKIRTRTSGGSFAIVAAKYNGRYVEGMIRAARNEIDGSSSRLEIIRVPGSFEIPVVAAQLAQTRPNQLSAIICFGVIFQGETSHAQLIGEAISHALAQIQVNFRIPVIHGVFVFQNRDQARVRCLGKTHNRGTEAARTALAMARVMKDLESLKF